MKLFIMLAAVAALFALFLRRRAARKRSVYATAVELESRGRFAEACYAYAVSAAAGFRAEDCRNGIRRLWRDHGPFSFSEKMEELRKDESCGCKSYVEGLKDRPFYVIEEALAEDAEKGVA